MLSFSVDRSRDMLDVGYLVLKTLIEIFPEAVKQTMGGPFCIPFNGVPQEAEDMCIQGSDTAYECLGGVQGTLFGANSNSLGNLEERPRQARSNLFIVG